MKDSDKIDDRTPIVAIVGISRFMLKDKSARTISEQATSIIDNYLQSFESSFKTPSKIKPFKITHLEEALSICVKFNPLFKNNSLSFERKFNASFLIGNRHCIFSELLKTLSTIAQIQKTGLIKLTFDTDQAQKYLRIYFRGSHLLPKDIKVAKTLFPKCGLVTSPNGKHFMDFDATILHYNKEEKKVNISNSKFPYLFKITGDQEDLVADIIETIIDSVPIEINNLQKAFQDQNLKYIGEIAHKMKPNFKNIERHDIAELLQEIEQKALSNDQQTLKLKISEFQEIAPLAIKELEKFDLQ